MTIKVLPFSDQVQYLPYFGQTLLVCRFLNRVTVSLLGGDERAIAYEFCSELESISRDGQSQQQWTDATRRPVLPQLLTWKPSSLARAFVYARDAVESALECQRICAENRVNQCVILSLLEIYYEPRFSQVQMAILLRSDLAQLSYVCREAKLAPWDGITNYILTRLTPCHALELVDPPIALEDEFR